MARFELPFLGPAYEARSQTLSTERCINWYFEAVESGKGKAPWALYGTPGLTRTVTLPGAGGVRSMHRSTRDGRPFVVQGNKLFELTSPTSFVERGTVSGKNTRVSMDNTALELAIVDGQQGWILNLDTGVFQQITDPSFFPANTVISTGGFFLFDHVGTNQIFFSNLLDGLSYTSTDFFSAEGSPDKVIGVHRSHGEVWAFGEDTTQVFVNTGGLSNPFTVLQNAFMETGTVSPYTMVQLDDQTYWVGRNEDGAGTVWRASGYTNNRISTHAVATALNKTDMASLTAYGYQEEDHFFYVIQTLSHTWTYDATNGLWTERGRLTDEGLLVPQRPWVHMFAFGKHLVGDQTTGAIYVSDLDVYMNDTEPISRIRRAPYWATRRTRSTHSMVEIDMEVGVGLNDGAASAIDPQITLAWSDTHGKEWSNVYRESLGKQGEDLQRVRFWRLGQTFDRVYESVVTAPVKVTMLGAYLEARVS